MWWEHQPGVAEGGGTLPVILFHSCISVQRALTIYGDPVIAFPFSGCECKRWEPKGRGIRERWDQRLMLGPYKILAHYFRNSILGDGRVMKHPVCCLVLRLMFHSIKSAPAAQNTTVFPPKYLWPRHSSKICCTLSTLLQSLRHQQYLTRSWPSSHLRLHTAELRH